MSQPRRRFLSIHIGKIRRHCGDSFARQAAYITRSSATNPRTGRSYDYSTKGDIEDAGLLGWSGSFDQLITAATFAERRKKAVEGRVAILALPNQLNRDQRHTLVYHCAAHLAAKYRVAVAYAIHPPDENGDQRNWHAHVLFTSREVEGLQMGRKTRELDSLRTGGQHIEAFRAGWCNEMNAALRAAGHIADIEHRSFTRVGIEAEPTEHLGERRTAIRRRRARERSTGNPTLTYSWESFRPLNPPSCSLIPSPIPPLPHEDSGVVANNMSIPTANKANASAAMDKILPHPAKTDPTSDDQNEHTPTTDVVDGKTVTRHSTTKPTNEFPDEEQPWQIPSLSWIPTPRMNQDREHT